MSLERALAARSFWDAPLMSRVTSFEVWLPWTACHIRSTRTSRPLLHVGRWVGVMLVAAHRKAEQLTHRLDHGVRRRRQPTDGARWVGVDMFGP
jgi:hypothetical protein